MVHINFKVNVVKKYLYAILCIAIMTLCYFAYDYHKQKEFIESIAPIIKDVSSRVTNVLSYETGSQSITYDELMARLETEISAIDNKIIEMQRVAADTNREKADCVLSYLKSAQDLLRSHLSMTRTYLDWKVAMNLYKQDVDLYNTLGVREIDRDSLKYAQQKLTKSFEEVSKKLVEVHEAIRRFESSAMTLSDQRTQVSHFVPNDVIVDASLLENVMNNIKDRKAGFSSLIEYHKKLRGSPDNKTRS